MFRRSGHGGSGRAAARQYTINHEILPKIDELRGLEKTLDQDLMNSRQAIQTAARLIDRQLSGELNRGQALQVIKALEQIKENIHSHRKILNRRLKRLERLISSSDKYLEKCAWALKG
ncbi:MAG TPA: hypothetical protein VJC16_00180 [Candidatus Nanoarchaeia archaeon]|nr:hypothetical protein [Candidatus Nanoarchaeia archaeon]